jgi:hypothetical protein
MWPRAASSRLAPKSSVVSISSACQDLRLEACATTPTSVLWGWRLIKSPLFVSAKTYQDVRRLGGLRQEVRLPDCATGNASHQGGIVDYPFRVIPALSNRGGKKTFHRVMDCGVRCCIVWSIEAGAVAGHKETQNDGYHAEK